MRFDTDRTTANKSLMLDRMTSQELSFELKTRWPGVLPLVSLVFNFTVAGSSASA